MASDRKSEAFQQFRQLHNSLCEELNMDQEAADKSWRAIAEILHNFNLDGKKEHWLCCALYSACRSSLTETVGNPGAQIVGNCVSTTQILRTCKISLKEFFGIMRRWNDMNSMPPEFCERVLNLETSFHTSLCVYNKFGPHFNTLFETRRTEEERRGKKSKPMPCSSKKLFEFAWCLFICGKAEYPEHSVDMVTSVNMLICCLDVIFSNAIDDKRTDIVQSGFPDCPPGWGTPDYRPPTTRPYSILERISADFDANYAETSRVSQYDWKPIMTKFFKKNILRGDADTFLNILTVENFDQNLKNLNSLYEMYVLSCGELDERIALSQQYAENPESRKALVPSTPLTHRQWVPSTSNPSLTLTPVGNAMRSVETLRTVLAGYTGIPEPSLLELLQDIDQSCLVRMQERLEKMSVRFCSRFRMNAQERFLMAEALYYKMVEFIIRSEMKKFKNPQQMQSLLDHDVFQTALIALCVDIVIYAYNHSSYKFPFILECFEIPAFNFWRVIELVARNNNDYLTRDILKHLTRIEEQIFEQILWESGSRIWAAIEQSGRLPLNQDCEAPLTPTSSAAQRIDDLAGIAPHNPNFNRQETGANPGDEIPNLTPPTVEIRRRLFVDESATTDSSAAAETSLPTTNGTAAVQPSPNPVVRPASRAGSLHLLFRKFYKLASVRIQELCKGLTLQDPQISSQIWTIFENSIVERTELLKDRHLDQIIMCAIYVFIRVKGGLKNLTFRDIMSQYRNQPQSASQVYRSVFIRNITPESEAESRQQPVQPAEPNDVNGIGQEHGNVLRGDIILFYNQNYVPEMKEFAMRFASQGHENDNLLLSPLPVTGRNIVSPKKINGFPLFIHPLEKNMSELLESPNSISYIVSSPSKGFQEIQKITNNRSKRSINIDGAMRPPKLSRIESLYHDRQEYSKK